MLAPGAPRSPSRDEHVTHRRTWTPHGAVLESAPAASNRGPRQAPAVRWPEATSSPRARRRRSRRRRRRSSSTPPRGGFPLSPLGNRGTGPRITHDLDETRSQDIPWSLCGVLLYVATLFTRRGRRPPPQRRGRTLCPMIGPVDPRLSDPPPAAVDSTATTRAYLYGDPGCDRTRFPALRSTPSAALPSTNRCEKRTGRPMPRNRSAESCR